jgi:hypothetical protein
MFAAPALAVPQAVAVVSAGEAVAVPVLAVVGVAAAVVVAVAGAGKMLLDLSTLIRMVASEEEDESTN